MAWSLAQEQKLVEQAQKGDEKAYEELIVAFSDPLYRVIARMAGDPMEAEAVIQEAFWRVWRSFDRYQNDRPFFPYLVTVAVNIQRDRWRSERWMDDRELEQAASQILDRLALPEQQVEQNQRSAFLAEAVRRMPAPFRAVIALRYDAEMSYEEIAQALSLPVNTVKTHLHRAKNLLRKMMEKYEHGSDG